jgi:DNA-binding response OmpR family regulator
MAKILIVDDEQHIIELVTLYLQHEGYQVTGVGNGEAARAQLQTIVFDLVILDLMLPDIDGFTICSEIRSKSDVPILMLTARKEDVDKIVGLEIGADDYLTKPFNPRELVARVRAILRRREARSKTTEGIEVGKLRIDLLRHEATVAGAPITLRSKEFALLVTLAQNLGIVFSREKLIEIVWGYDYYGETRTVDVHINHLRDKLSGSGTKIDTIRGTGYKMKVVGKQK